MSRVAGLSHHTGGCSVCGIEWDSRNVHGLAAKHHYKTGHQTWVELRYLYARKEEPQAEEHKGETEDENNE
jgi:hypothetical protein